VIEREVSADPIRLMLDDERGGKWRIRWTPARGEDPGRLWLESPQEAESRSDPDLSRSKIET